VALLPPCVCFHIEHSLGSGWTPEGEKKLFERLNQKEILNPEWHVLMPLVEQMRQGEHPTALNGPTWGLSPFELPEAPLVPGNIQPTAVEPRPFALAPNVVVGALLPAFDLDRLTLWQDRRNSPVDRLNQIIEELRRHLSQAEDYNRKVEKDRQDRLDALVDYENRMASTLEYMKKVEKDREDRLAAIHYYQGKLQQAYADHEHNVAYINGIHAELAAHVKASAEKDAIIAHLAEQLRTATESRAAGS
jgi:hypothetical protein